MLDPVFVVENEGSKKAAMPLLREEGEVIDLIEFITKMSKFLKTNIDDLLVDDLGKLTLGAYVLLETLYLAGKNEKALKLASSTEELTNAAMIFTLGMVAGRQIPKDLEIITTYEEDLVRVREDS